MKNLYYSPPALHGLQALSCLNNFEFESHIHSGHVLWLNSEGGEYYQVQGNSSILQPGCISVIEPGIVHSNQPIGNNKRHLRSLYLEEDFFRNLERLLTGTTTQTINLPTRIFDSRTCWADALLLHEAVITGQDNLLLEELAISLFCSLKHIQVAGLSQKNPRVKEDKRIHQIVEYMKAHLADNVSLDTLADIAQCSSFHVVRLFKQKVGMSPHAYFIQLRLECARELIDNGQHLCDAALQAGFSDQSHLTRRFKKRYGVTPGAYTLTKADT